MQAAARVIETSPTTSRFDPRSMRRAHLANHARRTSRSA
ncbi:putative ribonucleotide-diphosphate reductase subunit alpha [Burkholderia thailandensis]|nr:putative ribonucleotide-diphosphate reductase subunit alpha [Burkholderia thailandensis]